MAKIKGSSCIPLGIPAQRKTLPEKWEELRIDNDFIFCKVMQKKDLMIELLHRILPDVDIIDIEIQAQKSIEEGLDIHGVRFDIFVKDASGRSVTVEMQVLKREHLPKRIRFYSSMADMEMLDKGIEYDKLKESYIIMICPFDFYGKGLHKYTFVNQCIETPSLKMNDGVTTIILNAFGTEDDINEKLKTFLDYVAGNKPADEFTRRLDMAVQEARMNRVWKREYTIANQRDLENRSIGREEGREEGRAEGHAEEREDILRELVADGTITQEKADSIRQKREAEVSGV